MESKFEPLEEILKNLAGKTDTAETNEKPVISVVNSNAGIKPENQKLSLPPEEMMGPYTLSYFQSMIQNKDICDKIFELAKGKGYYTHDQRDTTFTLDIYNTDKTPSTTSPGQNYSSLSPAQKRVVLAGLAKIVETENYHATRACVLEERKLNENKKKEADDWYIKLIGLGFFGLGFINLFKTGDYGMSALMMGTGTFIYSLPLIVKKKS